MPTPPFHPLAPLCALPTDLRPPSKECARVLGRGQNAICCSFAGCRHWEPLQPFGSLWGDPGASPLCLCTEAALICACDHKPGPLFPHACTQGDCGSREERERVRPPISVAAEEGGGEKGQLPGERWSETGPHSRPSSPRRLRVLHRAWPPCPFSSNAVTLISWGPFLP